MTIQFFCRPQLLRSALLGATLLSAMVASAQETPGDFASHAPLQVTGEGPWYRLELPLAVQLDSRQSDLADVRIFDAQGNSQPYSVVYNPTQPHQPSTPVDVKWFPLYDNADASDTAPIIRVERSASGALLDVQPQSDIEAGEEILRGWLLDTSSLQDPLERLTLDWSTEHEGLQRFTVEASDDLQTWQAWGEGQVARLSFADELVEQRDVALPGRTARYLRLLWKAPHSAPTLTSAQLTSLHTNTPSTPVTWSQPIEGSLAAPGNYLWELPGALPVEQLKIDIAQANSLAPANVYGRLDSNAPWEAIGSGLLYRLLQNGETMVQDEVQLPGKVVRQLRLEVDERGSGLGAQAPHLRVAVRATQVVFKAQGKRPFSLAVGNPSASAASVPLLTLIPDYDAQSLTSIGVATPDTTPIKTAAAAPLPPAPAGIDWKRAGLWGVLVLGFILLGWIALSSWRGSRRGS